MTDMFGEIKITYPSYIDPLTAAQTQGAQEAYKRGYRDGWIDGIGHNKTYFTETARSLKEPSIQLSSSPRTGVATPGSGKEGYHEPSSTGIDDDEKTGAANNINAPDKVEGEHQNISSSTPSDGSKLSAILSTFFAKARECGEKDLPVADSYATILDAKDQIVQMIREITGKPAAVKEGSLPCDVLAFYCGDIRERAKERGVEL